MSGAARLYHIAEPGAWTAGRDYQPAAFAAEGFVHLSTRAQVLATAERYYAGREGLQLLAIDPAALGAALVYEAAPGAEERFPHYYGAIPAAAVVDAAPLRLQGDGGFCSRLLD